MERGRYRRSSSCPCWLQRRSLAGSLWGKTAPSRAFKIAAAEEIFQAVSIAFKTDLLCLMRGDCHDSRAVATCEQWQSNKRNRGERWRSAWGRGRREVVPARRWISVSGLGLGLGQPACSVGRLGGWGTKTNRGGEVVGERWMGTGGEHARKRNRIGRLMGWCRPIWSTRLGAIRRVRVRLASTGVSSAAIGGVGQWKILNR
jgi:hypothetical protein